MINPPPRPALRKAPDSDLHPVAVAAAATKPAELRPVVGIGGRTSDTLVTRTPKSVKRVSFEVKVAKAVLRSAKKAAKKRGERLDDVVASALQVYADRR